MKTDSHVVLLKYLFAFFYPMQSRRNLIFEYIRKTEAKASQTRGIEPERNCACSRTIAQALPPQTHPINDQPITTLEKQR